MSTVRRALASFTIPFAWVAAIHCGGAVTANPAIANDAGGIDSDSDAPPPPNNNLECHNPSPPPVGRPTAAACPVTSIGLDAGNVACTTFADCQDAGGTDVGSYRACRDKKCVLDECLSDSDCPSGEACGCATQFRGNAIHFNRCVVSNCSVDADCGAGGICSQAFEVTCGSFSGYRCRSAADTCATDASCCQGDAQIAPQCNYAPELGHFACQERIPCGG